MKKISIILIVVLFSIVNTFGQTLNPTYQSVTFSELGSFPSVKDGRVFKYQDSLWFDNGLTFINLSRPGTGGSGSMVYPGAGIALSTGSGWTISITNNSSNWNTAYGWGNHSSAGYAKMIDTLGGAGNNKLASTYRLSLKQNNLISGTNIKTVNGTSLLGSGNIVISGGTSDSSWNSTKTGKGDDTLTVRDNGTLHQFFNHVEKIFTTTWGRLTAKAIKTDTLIVGNSEKIDTLYNLFDGLPYLKIKAGLSSTKFAASGTIKDFYADASTSGTGETDLYSYTFPAYAFSTNGDKITFKIFGKSNATATSPVLKFYFGTDNVTINSAAFSTVPFAFTIEIIRVSPTVCRVAVTGSSTNAQAPVYAELTGKDWTITNVLKITGQAATNDITLRLGYIEFKPGSSN